VRKSIKISSRWLKPPTAGTTSLTRSSQASTQKCYCWMDASWWSSWSSCAPETMWSGDGFCRGPWCAHKSTPSPGMSCCWRIRSPGPCLMGLRPGVPATDFLDRMAASAFHISGSTGAKPPSDLLDPLVWPAPPHHLLGLFHRRQVGKVGSQRLRIDILPSTGSTAVELAEMGVKLTAKKTNIFGDLSLAPLVLNDVTVCWILNMVAYEAGLATSRSADNFAVGTRQDDNFFVSSYVSFFAKLVKRGEDVQELRAIGHHQQRYDR
jgi:hypothetical protein